MHGHKAQEYSVEMLAYVESLSFMYMRSANFLIFVQAEGNCCHGAGIRVTSTRLLAWEQFVSDWLVKDFLSFGKREVQFHQ